MDINDNLSDDLAEIAPHLHKIAKEQPFSVPENYFEALPSIIQERCVTPKQTPWYNIILRPKFALSLSSFLIVLMVGLYVYNNNTTKNSFSGGAELAISDNFEIENIDEAILIEMLAESPSVRDEKKEALENYLIENLDDNQIATEL